MTSRQRSRTVVAVCVAHLFLGFGDSVTSLQPLLWLSGMYQSVVAVGPAILSFRIAQLAFGWPRGGVRDMYSALEWVPMVLIVELVAVGLIGVAWARRATRK